MAQSASNFKFAIYTEPGWDPTGHDLNEIDAHIRKYWHFDPADAIPIPIPAGGALFFYGMLPHETPPNRSALRRRAMQFHYRGRDTQMVDRETYDKVFAEADGTPASCAAARG